MRKGPLITIAEDQDFYDDQLVFDFKQENFRVAFAVQPAPDFGVTENKNDPDYVRWVARIATVKDGVEVFTPLSTHVCTEADYSKFYEPNIGYAHAINQQMVLNGLMCFDDESYDLIKISGESANLEVDHKRLDINFLPCIEDVRNNKCRTTLQ